MATLIPPMVSSDCSSPGEREIFLRLRDDRQTDDWFILHSLDVAKHRRQLSGEIDFVIVVPGRGVLCLEVKASARVKRENGLWYYGSIGPDARGPFRQASTAMHSIREQIAAKRPDLARLMFWSAVAFPYFQFEVISDEWHDWQVIDRRGFTSQPFPDLVRRVLDSANRFVRNHPAGKWFDPDRSLPTPAQAEDIAELLRPSFEFFESPKSRAERRNDAVKRYTADQFDALDGLEANDRIIITGPAGTGKTVLAVETARRAAASGRRVLLVCYNKQLGRHLREEVELSGADIWTGTLHSWMLHLTGAQVPRNAADQAQFWQQTLPELALAAIVEAPSGEGATFDEVVVDEAQDLLRPEYLDVLDLGLRGGLSAGRWRFFGDFEKQSIYAAEGNALEEFMSGRGRGVSRYELRNNCRNTPRIASWVQLLGGLNPDYRKILRPDDGREPKLRYYQSARHQAQVLVEVLEEFYAEGFVGDAIAILSARSHADSCAHSITDSRWAERLASSKRGPGYVQTSSIHAFKGLEADAVVVTDIDALKGQLQQALFYIATTRALHRLVILAADSARGDVTEILTRE